MTDHLQVVYFPYLALHGVDELRFGSALLRNSSHLDREPIEEAIRDRVNALLESHRLPSASLEKSAPVSDMGVVVVEPSFRPLTKREHSNVELFRSALFLACLSNNVRLSGPNAGHDVYTAENFNVVIHNFTLSKPYFSEETGVIVRFRHMGYKIGDVRFPTPSHIPRPMQFRYDKELWAALDALRGIDRRMYRRVLRAASVLIESYYNASNVDTAARVLLQATAFEILLDLPNRKQRYEFKNRIEALTVTPGDRRYRYKFETRGEKQPETRTQKGIWADRFYTLRNHIIHGEDVPASEYVYRRTQHHLVIAPMFFMMCMKRIVAEAFSNRADAPQFFDHLHWHSGNAVEEYPEDDDRNQSGFRIDTDWGAHVEAKLEGIW